MWLLGSRVSSAVAVCHPVPFRYLRRLHFSLKKGRWDPKEEEQLLELIAKYGVGKLLPAVLATGCLPRHT